MVKKRLTVGEKNKIVILRKKGKTLVEIGKIVKRPKSTISRLTKGLIFSDKIQNLIDTRSFGSKIKAKKDWEGSLVKARKIVNRISNRDRILITSALYWGEGNKKEFNIINSDPVLLATVVNCLKGLGVSNAEIKVGLRLYSGVDKKKAIDFWSRALAVPRSNIAYFEEVINSSTGKLTYGMCRVRVSKGAHIFKLMMSVINLIKIDTNAAVVQRIEQGTPKS